MIRDAPRSAVTITQVCRQYVQECARAYVFLYAALAVGGWVDCCVFFCFVGERFECSKQSTAIQKKRNATTTTIELDRTKVDAELRNRYLLPDSYISFARPL